MTETAPHTKSFPGNYLVWRKLGERLHKGLPGPRKDGGSPKFRHPSFAAAEAEATRLVRLHPDCSFVILHEVARVRMKPVDPESASRPSLERKRAA